MISLHSLAGQENRIKLLDSISANLVSREVDTTRRQLANMLQMLYVGIRGETPVPYHEHSALESNAVKRTGDNPATEASGRK
jgi:hypothetical protein